MRIDPVIEALRSDPAPQRHAQAAMDAARSAWADGAASRLPLAQLAAYGSGGELGDLPDLSAVMTDVAAASALVTSLVDTLGAAMRAEPLGLVPFRHQTSDSHVVLELARAGRAALSVMVYRPSARLQPQAVCLTSGDRRELCLRGKGEGLLVELRDTTEGRADLVTATVPINQGWSAAFDNARQGKIVTEVFCPLVILRLQRDLPDPLPAREYRLADGRVIHESAADKNDSRHELALALLGGMGRADALPIIAEAALAGPAHVRWEAVRQGLALDSGAGFAVLSGIAGDAADPLSPAAEALRAHLIKAYPQLRQVQERAACHA